MSAVYNLFQYLVRKSLTFVSAFSSKTDSELAELKNKIKEIEAMLAQKMINELKFEKPSLIQKIIRKKSSAQLPIQGIELPQASRPNSIFKRIAVLLVLIAALGLGYWLLNPYLNVA